ncbi:hypothetical protein [Streptomyces sp. NPDC020607]|uniref:hypothetical protein n=1 Tax=Streptomyces sp. NPDC020607 TaxID=3365082 RepID=UPI00379B558F
MSQSVLAREIFGPLGGLVEIGAVVSAGSWSLADVSVGAFVDGRREHLARVLALIRDIGEFDPDTMLIFDELGYARDHPVAVPSLLLSSGGYEEVSPRLGEPGAVRRMSRMGADLQLTRYLQALVNAAIARGADAAEGAPLVREALGIAVRITGDAPEPGAATVFAMWRVAFLAEILRPDSAARPDARDAFRQYAHALEDALGAR